MAMIQKLESENRLLKSENKRLQKALEAYRQTQIKYAGLAKPVCYVFKN